MENGMVLIQSYSVCNQGKGFPPPEVFKISIAPIHIFYLTIYQIFTITVLQRRC